MAKQIENGIKTELSNIRRQVESLNLPSSAYIGIHLEKQNTHFTILGQGKFSSFRQPNNKPNLDSRVINWIQKYSKRNNVKFIAAGISGNTFDLPKLRSRLWLEEDIAGIIHKNTSADTRSLEHVVHNIESRFDAEQIAGIRKTKDNEILVDDLAIYEDYKKITPTKELKKLETLVKEFKGKRLLFISATPRGGGVALMRHALIRLFRLLGVDAHWHILQERAEIFEITKTKFHNVLQAVNNPKVYLTDGDKALYNAWIIENAQILNDSIKKSDVIVIDDKQPSGLIPIIKRNHPNIKIIYRSHIQIESHLTGQKGMPQAITWEFVWNNIKDSDFFISHPIDNFIPKELPRDRVVTMPATTDQLDGLNKPLNTEQNEYYIKLFNKFLLENNQTPLDLNRPYIIQIARFDPSKGIPDVIESFRLLRNQLKSGGSEIAPQLVIAGHGSIDDPDGIPVLNLAMEILREDRYSDIAADVKLARVHHSDQILNAILRQSKIALQLSHKEGFEIKVTEALMKGIPIIAYRAGGIPLQIEHNKTGFIVEEIGDTTTVAKYLHQLLTNKNTYNTMSKNAALHHRKDVFTIPNAIRLLYLANSLFNNNKILTKNI